MYHSASNSELVEMVLAGNTKSFTCLVKRHQEAILSLLSRRFPHNVVEGLAREIFVDAFCELESFRKNELFAEWLLVIALRRCHNYRCEIYTPRKETLTLETSGQNCLKSITNTKCFSDFRFSDGVGDLRDKVLGQLTPEDQLLVECLYFENYPVKTMARVLQCNRLMIRLKAGSAKRKMRKVMAELFVSSRMNNEFNTARACEI